MAPQGEAGMKPEERKALEALFEGHSPVPGAAKQAPAAATVAAPEGTEPVFTTPDGAPPAGYRPSVPPRLNIAPAPTPDAPAFDPNDTDAETPPAPDAIPDEAPVIPIAPVQDAPGVGEEQGEVVVPHQAPVTAPVETAPSAIPAEPVPTDPNAPAAPVPGANEATGPDIYMDMSRLAVLRLLNKQTTRTRNLEVAENNKLSPGTLEIALEECWHSAPDAKDESAALIRVFETRQGGTKREEIFYGWLFSATPSLNHLEHPVYDLTLVTCK